MSKRGGNAPIAHAFLAGREHDLPCVERLLAVRAQNCRPQEAVRRGRDVGDFPAIAHRQIEHLAVPQQIIGPIFAGDQAKIAPALIAKLRFVPGLVGQARNVEIGTSIVFGAAQRRHARIGPPRALKALLGLVQHETIRDLRTFESKGDGKARLTGADDQHVERGSAVRACHRRQPWQARMGYASELGTDPRGESCKTIAHAALHARPPCTLPSPPASRSIASVSSAPATSRSTSATTAPSRANSSALARPTPEPPPVTTAARPESLISLSSAVIPQPAAQMGRRGVTVEFRAPAKFVGKA